MFGNDDSMIYKVVVNHEEQYSIWPADRENALGWNDAGKSGTMFLAVLVAWLITGVAVNRLVVARFLPAPPPVDPHFLMASMSAQMAANALPGTIVSVIISLAFALAINEELKSDPAENAYGPPPGA